MKAMDDPWCRGVTSTRSSSQLKGVACYDRILEVNKGVRALLLFT